MAHGQLAQGIRLSKALWTMPRIPIRRSHLFYSHFVFYFSLVSLVIYIYFILGLNGNPLFYGVPSLGYLETPKAH